MPSIHLIQDYDAKMRHLLSETLMENSGLRNEERNRSLSILSLVKKLGNQLSILLFDECALFWEIP